MAYTIKRLSEKGKKLKVKKRDGEGGWSLLTLKDQSFCHCKIIPINMGHTFLYALYISFSYVLKVVYKSHVKFVVKMR